MLLTYLKLSFKELTRRRRSALYTISGIILSGALFAASAIAIVSFKNSLGSALFNVGADIVVQTHGEPCFWAPVKLPTNLNPIPVDTVEKTRKVKGVKRVSGVLIAWAFDGGEGNLHPTVIAGVEPWERELGPLKLSQAQGGSGNLLVKGRYLDDLDVYAVVLDYDFAQFLKADVGETATFGGQKFEVVGIIRIGREARIAGAQAFMPLSTAQEMLKRGEVVDTVFVRLASGADLKQSAQELKKLYGENSSITTSTDFPQTISGLVTFTDMFVFGLLVLIIIAGAGFSLRSISASISGRLKELCIMKAIGWMTIQLRRLLFIESLIVSSLGSILGVGIGVFFALTYVYSVRLRLPEILVNYPPCASTAAKTEIAAFISQKEINVIIFITIFVLILLSGITSIISSGGLKKTECAEGMRRL